MKIILPYISWNEHDYLFKDAELVREILAAQIDLSGRIEKDLKNIVIVTNHPDCIDRSCGCDVKTIECSSGSSYSPLSVIKQVDTGDDSILYIDPHYPLLKESDINDFLSKSSGSDFFTIEKTQLHPFYLLKEFVDGSVDFILPRFDENRRVIIGRQDLPELYSFTCPVGYFNSRETLFNISDKECRYFLLFEIDETKSFSLLNGYVDYCCICEIMSNDNFYAVIGNTFTIAGIEKLYNV